MLEQDLLGSNDISRSVGCTIASKDVSFVQSDPYTRSLKTLDHVLQKKHGDVWEPRCFQVLSFHECTRLQFTECPSIFQCLNVDANNLSKSRLIGEATSWRVRWRTLENL